MGTLGKLTIIIGAGIVGSIVTKEGGSSTLRDIFSGTLKIVTKHLHQDKDNTRSSSKPQTDSLLAQVNNLRQELQTLASSRSVTIISATTGSATYGVTAVIVVGVVGYGCIWWKGWKLSDMMFVTRSRFSDACNTVGKQLEVVSSAITSAKQHLSSRIDRVDSNLDECKILTATTKEEVHKMQGSLGEFHGDVTSVRLAVQNLESKLELIEDNQDFANRGILYLTQFAQRLQESRNMELLQDSGSSPRKAIEHSQTAHVTRTGSLPPLALEPSSPSSSSGTPKVLRPSTSVSPSGLKELQDISAPLQAAISRSSSLRASPSGVSDRSPATVEASSSNSNSSRFGWKLPGIGLLSRSKSTGN